MSAKSTRDREKCLHKLCLTILTFHKQATTWTSLMAATTTATRKKGRPVQPSGPAMNKTASKKGQNQTSNRLSSPPQNLHKKLWSCTVVAAQMLQHLSTPTFKPPICTQWRQQHVPYFFSLFGLTPPPLVLFAFIVSNSNEVGYTLSNCNWPPRRCLLRWCGKFYVVESVTFPMLYEQFFFRTN